MTGNKTLSHTGESESVDKARTERADSVFGLGDILEQEPEDEGALDDAEGEEEKLQPIENPEPEANVVVTVEDGRFSWNTDFGKPTLSVSNIVVPSGRCRDIKLC
jgi:hypothetical protein